MHAASGRRDKPFIGINCGAIPDALLESELFGYTGGAFTGASAKGRIGKFELAHKGVLFLDEISTMPLYLQVKLLRVLQERAFTRLGSNRLIEVDIRIIAATNEDLAGAVRQGRFREDLFYRLNVIRCRCRPCAIGTATSNCCPPFPRPLQCPVQQAGPVARRTCSRPSPPTRGPATCASSRM
ncbi:MAG: sigma 54-interacting transcriptional regulator [Bilophila wadsworthia]